MKKESRFLIINIVLSILLAGCVQAKLPDLKGNELYINNNVWNIGLSEPSYDDSGFYYVGVSPSFETHTLACYVDLSDVQKMDNVTPEYLLLGMDNAEYICISGKVVVSNISKYTITLNFDNFKVKYIGKYINGIGDNRGNDIINDDILLINGTVSFIYHP